MPDDMRGLAQSQIKTRSGKMNEFVHFLLVVQLIHVGQNQPYDNVETGSPHVPFATPSKQIKVNFRERDGGTATAPRTSISLVHKHTSRGKTVVK